MCPGPNIAWFDREYTLREMVDHIYGRGASLVPAARPHCLAKELEMYVDHFVGQAEARRRPETRRRSSGSPAVEENLQRGLAHYGRLVREPAYEGENLASLADAVEVQAERLAQAWDGARARPPGHVANIAGASIQL